MIYDLPTTLEVCGVSYDIRSDYRAVLDICTALSDIELSDQDRGLIILDIFYPAFAGYKSDDGEEETITMPPEHYEEAIKMCFWFIACGDKGDNRKSPKLMDWEKDFKYIVAPVNRVMGQEIRSIPYLHWWTFVSAYYEIGGECTFAQIVRIRERLARGKKLEKEDREWYRKNRELVDMKTAVSESEKELLKEWGV